MSLIYQGGIYRGVYLGHRNKFGSQVLGRFKIGSCVHINVYLILKSFESLIKSSSFTRSVGRICFDHLSNLIRILISTFYNTNSLLKWCHANCNLIVFYFSFTNRLCVCWLWLIKFIFFTNFFLLINQIIQKK